MRLIDADALLKRISETFPAGYFYLPNDFREAVEDAPIVDAVPVKHGQWEEQTKNSNEEETYIDEWQSARCNVCKRYLTTPYLYYYKKYNYCPHCGAKMDGKKVSE